MAKYGPASPAAIHTSNNLEYCEKKTFLHHASDGNVPEHVHCYETAETSS